MTTQRIVDPFRFLLISVAGWMIQQQQLTLDYLREENRILKEQLGEKGLRLNDDQRRRLASKAKRVGVQGRNREFFVIGCSPNL